MIAATGHAALMDDVYRRQRHIYDFTRKYYLFGRDRMIAGLALKADAQVVEIGCGTARNLIKMAKAYPKAVFYGLDASQEMLVTARAAVERAGMGARIRLAHGLAENLTPAMFGLDQPFDCCVFSYSISMIPDWKQALAAAALALHPDGQVHLVDFGDLAGLGRQAAWLLTKWLQLFHVSPRLDIVRRLESMPDDSAENAHIQMLPARYAFIWHASSKAALSLSV